MVVLERILLPAVLAAVLAAPASHADVALGVHGGTLGLGGSVTLGLSEQVNLRGIVNRFEHDFDDEAGDIEYAIDATLSSYGVLLDWHPGGAGLRFSAGVLGNDNEADGVGVPSESTVEIGDSVFPTSEAGTLEADVTFDDFAPYVGIGWGNAVGPDKRWGFNLDLGVVLQGEPKVEFRSVGANPLLVPLIEAEIAAEEDEIQSDLDDLDVYPVLTLGVSYRL